MKSKTVKLVEVSDWDDLVQKTYGRPYNFQQQNDCQDRGIHELTVPDEDYDNEMHDEIPEEVNGPIMGVKFAVWLARDPKQPLSGKDDQDDFSLSLWWERNFYPDLQTVANDLHAKGLLEAGQYTINIDW